jgi:hypothetical protein
MDSDFMDLNDDGNFNLPQKKLLAEQEKQKTISYLN